MLETPRIDMTAALDLHLGLALSKCSKAACHSANTLDGSLCLPIALRLITTGCANLAPETKLCSAMLDSSKDLSKPFSVRRWLENEVGR